MNDNDIYIWIVDKYFLPPPVPSKNRYMIFLDMPNIKLTVFSSKFSEYNKKKPVAIDDDKDCYRNARWVYVPSANISRTIFYISFAFFLIFKSLSQLIKESKKPNVIIVSCPDPFQALAALFVSRIIKVPLVTDFRDYWPELLSDIGILKERSMGYQLLFLLTKILAKSSKGIMAVEGSYIRKYLEKRVAFSEKPIFIRQNIFIDSVDSNSGDELVNKEKNKTQVTQIIKDIENLRTMRTYVLLIVGRQNIGHEDVKLIHKCLEMITLEAGIVILSNDTKIGEVFDISNPAVKLHSMLDRKSYLKVLEGVDALLSFVTDVKTEFSSNKMFDALSRGKPVLVGFSSLTQTPHTFSKIPGVIPFEVDSFKAIKNSIEKMSRILTDNQMQKNISDFCVELYMLQKNGLLKFLREISQTKV